MRFTLFIATSVAVSGVVGTPTPQLPGLSILTGWIGLLTPQNHYNSPIEPWKQGAKPGWYYGNNPVPNIPYLSGLLCDLLALNPFGYHCPVPIHNPPYYPPYHTHKTTAKSTSTVKTTTTVTTTDTVTQTITTTVPATTTTSSTPTPTPTNGYFPTFSNITAATQADDFQTFGLVDTIDQCLAMCNSVKDCVFVNVFNDVNAHTQLTCSLFSGCHDASSADNRGGQSQPNGSLDFIANSDGFCQIGNTIVDSQ